MRRTVPKPKHLSGIRGVNAPPRGLSVIAATLTFVSALKWQFPAKHRRAPNVRPPSKASRGPTRNEERSMRKFAILAAVAAAALMAAPVSAHADWYAGLGYTQYEPEDADENGGVTARLGYRMNPNFA